MNFDIGSKIKSLRLANSMTQEQLAQELGVSAQAVSKWESNTNMPDIQMLPELAMRFGVSIDELFAITDDSRLDRIENQIGNIRFLSHEEFKKSEEFLKDCLKKQEHEARSTLLLAQLYNKRADEYHTLAKPLGRKALHLNSTLKDPHNAIFDAECGPYTDWTYINHEELIAFYQQFIRQHPENRSSRFWLLNLLIADHRLEEARQCMENMEGLKNSYQYEKYMGRICKEACDLDGAMNWWKKMTEHEPENWLVWAEYGDVMAKLCRYKEAVQYYKKSMPLRPRPRFVDCEESVYHICMIQGNLKGALAMQQQMLQIVLDDWTTEGEMVDEIKRKIRDLETKMKNS